MKIYQFYWQLIRFRPKYYAADLIGITVFSVLPAGLGLVLRAFFNYLTGEDGLSLSLWPVVGLQIVYALTIASSLAMADIGLINFEYQGTGLLIRNMIARILNLPGGTALPKNQDGSFMSTGQVISTLRDGASETVLNIALFDDLIALSTTTIVTMSIMFQISPLVTLGTFIPLAIIIFVAQGLGKRAEQFRQASREATSHVTGAIADMFNATQAIKIGGAEERIMQRFQGLNEQRQTAMVKDRFLTEFINALSYGTVDLGVGLILLFAAQAMFAGTFTVGDFALFAAYIWPPTLLMRLVGNIITRYRQAGVSLRRMETIMQGMSQEAVEDGAIYPYHDQTNLQPPQPAAFL